MADFAGRDVMLRFRFGTDSSVADVGVFVDDITLPLPPAPATPSPPRPSPPEALAVDAAGNGVFQPNETVVMAPDVAQHRRRGDHPDRRAHQPHRPGGPDVHDPRRRRRLRHHRRGRPRRAARRPATATACANTAATRPVDALGQHGPRDRDPHARPPRPGRCTSATASPTCRRRARSTGSSRRSCTRT